MNTRPGFFDFAAEVGLTKHIGGIEATDALAALCQIGKDSYVLDVGCGVGATPCYLAKKYSCRVMGVDISEKMVERSWERVRREKLDGRVELRAADAQALPFADSLFDAVMTESVTAFPLDKQKAVSEYARVTRPGGIVGLNETVWLKLPPPPEVIAWAEKDVGANLVPLTPQAWSGLLETAGLHVLSAKTYSINARAEAQGLLKRYGLGGMLRITGRMLRLYLRDPAYRQFVREVRRGEVVPVHLDEYFGYGLFIGQKPG